MQATPFAISHISLPHPQAEVVSHQLQQRGNTEVLLYCCCVTRSKPLIMLCRITPKRYSKRWINS